MRLIPYGPENWLIRWDSRETCETELFSLLAEINATSLPGFVESVPGYQTLLIICNIRHNQSQIQSYLEKLGHANGVQVPEARVIEIPVIYEGADLAHVAETHQIPEAEVVRRHSQPVYSVYFMGFSPGFPYLGPLDPSLHTPRRESPRTRIPAGSVAIGGSHTGIYSIDSPGGWHIIGHTSHPMFELDAAENSNPVPSEIFTFQPGDHIKLIPQPSITA